MTIIMKMDGHEMRVNIVKDQNSRFLLRVTQYIKVTPFMMSTANFLQ